MESRLILPVNGIYFDQMVAGTKPFEYRLRNEYWHKRLVDRQYSRLIITRGYPKNTEYNKRLVLPYLGYELQTISHPHFNNIPVDVYAIIIDYKQRIFEV